MIKNNNLLREKKEYDGNPVGLTKDVALEIAEHLDRHLAALQVLYHQYHKHHWLVEGPQFRDLHLFLEENYTQIHEAFDEVAERITVMGISPTCHPVEWTKLSYIEHEPEGVYRIRTMLENDMESEKTISIELRKSIKVALSLEDFASKKLMEEILADTEDRAHHIEHFLGEDTLAIGLTIREKELLVQE